MYVIFEDDSGYSKLAELPAFIEDVYPYDESMNASIILHMGKNGWRKMGDTKFLL
ncbi:hypothetical protein [Cohnella terricola]|uniref:hypothetical protein n=1 Tax=Cohnella terricola TaxID=1289167 RepID=UPI001648977E|nr:hypothetical protein [Cohnella terricola]